MVVLLLHWRSRPHVSLLTRVVLVRLSAVWTADVGIRIVDISLWAAVLRLWVDVCAIRRSR